MKNKIINTSIILILNIFYLFSQDINENLDMQKIKDQVRSGAISYSEAVKQLEILKDSQLELEF